MRYFIFVTVLLSIFSCSLPKSHNEDFQGKAIYKISSPINNPHAQDSSNYQVVYMMDSMLRIDSYTPIGKQKYIKHIPRNRAYILMDLGHQKVAIQTIPDSIGNNGKYTYKNKMGSDEIAGRKAKRVKVTDHDQDTTFVVNYFPEVSPKYSNALDGLPGLPVKYSIYSSGIWISYELIEFEERQIDRDYFGIPSDHDIITLDQFMEMLQKEN
tara:strand:- start:73524 stop:74159 length:636 start_codon:yes stop_codon:yes gene_type:complete